MKFATLDGIKLSTGLIVRDEYKRYIFIVYESNQWLIDRCKIIVPFGGIGGKVLKDESPFDAAKREAYEETSDCTWNILSENSTPLVLSSSGEQLPWEGKYCINKLDLLPKLILVNHNNIAEPRIIYIYEGIFRGRIKPRMPHPALIHIDSSLLPLFENRNNIDTYELLSKGLRFSFPKDLVFGICDFDNVSLQPIGTANLLVKIISNQTLGSEW
jgi:hypothetical protein